jgi:hypothetical protein
MAIVTRTEMLAHLDADDGAVSGETDRVNALPEDAIPAADLLGFSHFLDDYHAFSNAARARANTNIILRGQTLDDDDDQLVVYERQLREWQDHAATLGHPATSPIIPRDSAQHPSNEPGGALGGLAGDLDRALSLSTGTKIIAALAAAGVLIWAIKK